MEKIKFIFTVYAYIQKREWLSHPLRKKQKHEIISNDHNYKDNIRYTHIYIKLFLFSSLNSAIEGYSRLLIIHSLIKS